MKISDAEEADESTPPRAPEPGLGPSEGEVQEFVEELTSESDVEITEAKDPWETVEKEGPDLFSDL